MAHLRPDLTPFARQYGPVHNANYSLITPVAPRYPVKETPEQVQHRIIRENYQRRWFCGFTSRELAQLDVISTRDLKPSDFNHGIIPILAKDRWEIQGPAPVWKRSYLYPISNGQGFWSVDNPDVWRVLEPCLLLASRYMMSMHCLPWFDAFMTGPRKPIAPDRLMFGESLDGLYSYSALPGRTPDMAAAVRDQMLDDLLRKWDLRWYFLSAWEYPDCSRMDPPGHVMGFCAANEDQITATQGQAPWRIGNFLAYVSLELLMRPDLTPANRLMLQWETANVLVHEIMHALQIPLTIGPLFHRKEPYFELGPIAEAGFDYETIVVGAITRHISVRSGFVPVGYFMETVNPSFKNIKGRFPGTKILTNPGPYDYTMQYPIPVTLYEDVHQTDFWEIGIRAFGFPFLSCRHVKEGARLNFSHHFNLFTHEYTWSALGEAVRVGILNPPFTGVMSGLQAQVQQLEMVMMATPFQRAAKDFGEKIVKSAQEEDTFWESYNQQESKVDMLQALASLSQPNDQERLEIVANVTTLITEAIYYHSTMVMSVISSEKVNNTPHNERRQGLLDWNRGCRDFVQDFVAVCSNLIDQAHRSTWDNILFNLEACRMSLWSPLRGPWACEDHREYMKVLSIGNSSDGRRDICNSICADRGSSVFGIICSKIGLCLEHANDVGKWAYLRDVLTEQIDLLEKLRQFNLIDWSEAIQEWTSLATNSRTELVRQMDIAQLAEAGLLLPLAGGPPDQATYGALSQSWIYPLSLAPSSATQNMLGYGVNDAADVQVANGMAPVIDMGTDIDELMEDG